MEMQINIIKKSAETEFAPINAMAKQLRGACGELNISLDRWRALEAFRTTTLNQGSAKLAAMATPVYDQAACAKVSRAFLAEMGDLGKVLNSKKPVSDDDCGELNEKARLLSIHLHGIHGQTSPQEYEGYKAQLKLLQDEARKVYSDSQAFVSDQLFFNDRIKWINRHLERIKPSPVLEPIQLPPAPPARSLIGGIVNRVYSVGSAVTGYLMPAKPAKDFSEQKTNK